MSNPKSIWIKSIRLIDANKKMTISDANNLVGFSQI